MHESSMRRMQWFADRFLDNQKECKILDIGSYDVNGSYKEIFERRGYNYTGLDMEEGPNVDICPKSPYAWTEIDNNQYDIVISGQALEHIEFFWVTVAEIVRVTKKDGIICLIAPNGFQEHRYPVDCWRFFTDGMIAIAKFYGLEILHAHTNAGLDIEDKVWFSEDCADSMLVAKKVYEGEARICDLKKYRCVPAIHSELRGEMSTYEEHKEYIKMKKKEGLKQNDADSTKYLPRKIETLYGRIKAALNNK